MTIAMQRTYNAERDRAPRQRASLALVIAALAACSSEPTVRAGGPSSSAPDTGASASAAARTFGEAWARAEHTGDDADLARLALEEGATGLLSAIDDPVRGPVALRALRYAPDRDIAIGPLAARLRKPGPDAVAVADALLGALAPAGTDRERLDPDGERAAAKDLLPIANDARADAALKAKVISALWRLAERGVVPRSEIPSGAP
jgi:hypothetical protein